VGEAKAFLVGTADGDGGRSGSRDLNDDSLARRLPVLMAALGRGELAAKLMFELVDGARLGEVVVSDTDMGIEVKKGNLFMAPLKLQVGTFSFWPSGHDCQ